MLVLALSLVLAAISLWALGFLFLNDFGVPSTRLPSFAHALIVFPHADDETNVAGLAWRLRRQGTSLTFVVLTRGESGTTDAHKDMHLKQVRALEMQGVSRRLGAGKLVQEDFGDGRLSSKRGELQRYMKKLLDIEKPDLVVTYDLSGLYGHKDHIVCTEIISELVKRQAHTELWFTVWPQQLLRVAHLPVHMAKDPHFADRRARPNMRLFIGAGTFAKIASVYGHKSQRQSFRRMMPFRLPIWLVYSLQLYEYYERVT